MELRRWALQIVGQDPAIQFRSALPKFRHRLRRGVPKILTKLGGGLIYVAPLLNPSRCEPIDLKQVMRHPQGRVLERIRIKWDRLALVGQIVEDACFHRLSDLALGNRFPLVHG